MQVKFTETVLRDANQSLIATRLPLNKFESILSEMDAAGYYSIECWGGAVFDSCLRYLQEDPWERLKIIKKNIPNTKLQMLLRGQNLLGYKHYPDDVVRKFVYNSVEKGIDIIRIFDAMNDLKNIEVALDETLKCGAHPSCAISYTVSPVHSVEKHIMLARDMESMGAKSICIKDMSGVLSPSVAFNLISQLKKSVNVPIVLHSHCSTGYAYMTYLKAIEAGVDVVDTAVSSFSGGTSQPSTEVISKIVVDSGHEVSLKMKHMENINEYFRKIMNDYIAEDGIQPKVLLTESQTIRNQIPGGMYSNLISQLSEQGMENMLDEVLDEVVRVREDLGYPPLVTPISQMVGTQATINVTTNSRYRHTIAEIKAYFRGEYGTPPGKVNQKLMMSLVGVKDFPKKRASKNLEHVYDEIKYKREADGYGRSDILTTILFPDIGEKFLERRNSKKKKEFAYNCEQYCDKANIELWHEITDNAASGLKAVITTILAFQLNQSVENIHIYKIYDIGG